MAEIQSLAQEHSYATDASINKQTNKQTPFYRYRMRDLERLVSDSNKRQGHFWTQSHGCDSILNHRAKGTLFVVFRIIDSFIHLSTYFTNI